jgi:anaphase-promoting complex subunit 8
MAATVVTVDGEMIDGLRRAINECADRGLQHASKWYARFCRCLASVLIHARRAAELLSAISPAKRRARHDLSFVSSTPARNSPAETSLPRVSFATPHPHGPPAGSLHSRVSDEEIALELDEEDVLSAGMATFRCREFARAAHILSACSSSRGRFLWLYSQYLVSHRFSLGRYRIITWTL